MAMRESHRHLSPEIQLLLCSGLIQGDEAVDAASRIRLKALLEDDIDWDHLIEIALYHKMLPLVSRMLNCTCPELLPLPVMDRLQEMTTHLAMRHIELTRELLRLIDLLNTHNIDALTFKGPTLTSLLSGDVVSRLYGDLDILVHPKDIKRARNLLLAHGYRLPLKSGNAVPEAEMLQYGHALPIEHETRHTLVDLHWRLGGALSPMPLTFETLWRHRQSVPLLGTPVKTFGTEDLLIYLCMHGAKHIWYKLGWICDIAALLRHQPDLLQHDAFLARVKACGAERMLLLGVRVAQQYFGAHLPEAISQQAKADPVVTSLLAEVYQRLLTPVSESDGRMGPRLYRRYLQLRMRERFRDRASLMLKIIGNMIRPTVKDREVLHLPSWASYLYYLVRPAHLLQRHGAKLFRR